MSIALGTLPDWIASCSTLGALVAAAFAAKAAYGQLKHMASQEESRASDSRRNQAEKIAVWIEGATNGEIRAYYSNSSSLPIYTCNLVCKMTWHDPLTISFATLGPTVEPRRLPQVEDALNKTTGKQITMIGSSQGDYIGFRPGAALDGLGYRKWGDLAANRVEVAIAFRDAAEAVWGRHPNGFLSEHATLGAAVGALGE